MRDNSDRIVLCSLPKMTSYKREKIVPLWNSYFPFRGEPFLEGIWCAGEKIVPLWSSYFPFRGEPFLEGIWCAGEKIVPLWSSYFPFRGEPFLEGIWCAGKQTTETRHTKLSTFKKRCKIYQMYLDP